MCAYLERGLILIARQINYRLLNSSSASIFQSASMSLKVGETVVCVSNCLNPDETPSYLASHLDPSCLHMALLL